MEGFEYNFGQIFSKVRQSVPEKIQVSVAKVKVTLRSQRSNNKIKHSFVSITSLYMDGL
jgi:hypothetical protein